MADSVDPENIASSEAIQTRYALFIQTKLSQCLEFVCCIVLFFLCPREDSQGALRFTPVCLPVCLSVCLSVPLRYRVCVINSSHSFQWIFLKPCIFVVDILKMCMWVFGEARINFDRITAL